MTLDEVHARAEKSWNVWGPCSGGVIVVFFCEGKLFTYYGGDARSADDDAPNPIEQTIEEYARGGGGDASVLDWLRATGHLGG
ncbi:MAG: hypothetical protein ABJE95_17750 [Byssovorax sp.]